MVYIHCLIDVIVRCVVCTYHVGSANVLGTSYGFLVTQYPVLHLRLHIHDREEVVRTHDETVPGLIK